VSTIGELLERKSSGSGLEAENTAVGIRHTDHVAPSDKLGWYSSLADSGHGGCSCFKCMYILTEAMLEYIYIGKGIKVCCKL
jgi:hypothetical protein